MLELVERTSSAMAKLELTDQVEQAEKLLNDLKKQFEDIIERKLTEDNEEKSKHFDQLRPTFGHPARKNDLQEIDTQEKQRQTDLEQTITQLRSSTIVRTNALLPIVLINRICFSGRCSNQWSSNSRSSGDEC